MEVSLVMVKGTELPLKEKAYNLIKEKIIHCEFMPGDDISEEQLAKEIGASRTPIREALLRLEQEKLVNIYPRKGIVIAPISVKEIHEVFQIREIVESQVAKIACKMIPEEHMLNFKEHFKKIDTAEYTMTDIEYFDLDIEFHKYIVSSSKNNHLIEFMNKIFDQDYRMRVIVMKTSMQERKRNRPEHLEIINAILQKDEAKIEDAIRKHIANARNAALKIVY